MPEYLLLFLGTVTDDQLDRATAQWTAIGIVGGLASFLIAVIGVWVSLHSLRRQLRAAHYTEIDKLYFELTALRITVDGLHERCEKPDIMDPLYGSYCLMLWNFIESIFDRCCDENSRFARVAIGDVHRLASRSALMKTWLPIIKLDGARHLEWFLVSEERFKSDFSRWVKAVFHLEIAAAASRRQPASVQAAAAGQAG